MAHSSTSTTGLQATELKSSFTMEVKAPTNNGISNKQVTDTITSLAVIQENVSRYQAVAPMRTPVYNKTPSAGKTSSYGDYSL